jgi:hypothetical protein
MNRGQCAQPSLLCFAIFGACSLAACGGTGSVSPFPTTVSSAGNAPSCAGAKSRSSYLYIADNNNAVVDVFATSSFDKGPVDQISEGVSYPQGIFVDSSQTLYVANGDESGHDTVTVYAKGSQKPTRTYKGFGYAVDVIEGSDGIVYIADYDDKRVVEYAPGSTHRLRVLHLNGYPSSLTLDSGNNLYVGYDALQGYSSEVKKYAAGATTGSDILPKNIVSFIGSVVINSSGELLVVNDGHGAVDVFERENAPPARTVNTTQTYPNSLAFDARENRLYVSSFYFSDLRGLTGSGPKGANTVVELSYPKVKRLATVRQSTWGPTGVAVFPGACFGPPF